MENVINYIKLDSRSLFCEKYVKKSLHLLHQKGRQVNMKNFVPINKMTKKQQKAYYDGQRQTWNGLNPVTRSVPNGKAYSRKKLKNTDRRNGRLSIHQDDLPFL